MGGGGVSARQWGFWSGGLMQGVGGRRTGLSKAQTCWGGGQREIRDVGGESQVCHRVMPAPQQWGQPGGAPDLEQKGCMEGKMAPGGGGGLPVSAMKPKFSPA